MPEGAVISAEDAWSRLEAGETGYLRGTFCGMWWDLSTEPLFVQLDAEMRLTTLEMTATQAGDVYRDLGVELGVMPHASGVNSGRRNMAVSTSQGLDREGWGQMNVKKAMGHQGKQGTATFEAQYDASPHCVDLGAFQMGRTPEKIEGIRSLTTTRVPELIMYRKFGDVDVYKADPIMYELIGSNSKLCALDKVLHRQLKLVSALQQLRQLGSGDGDGSGSEERKAQEAADQVTKERNNLVRRLQHRVVEEKRWQVWQNEYACFDELSKEQLDERCRTDDVSNLRLKELVLSYGCREDHSHLLKAVESGRMPS